MKNFLLFILILTNSKFAQSQFQGFINHVNSLQTSVQKTAAVDSFMIYAQNQGIPFIEDSTANFIYRGNSVQVNLAGDLNGWSLSSAYKLTRLPGTDFFYLSKEFENNARIDYKYVLDGSTWILDPNNPNILLGGFGPNSELAMPSYVQPWEIKSQNGISHGTLESKSIFSSVMNKNYQLNILLPPGYDMNTSFRYPTVYFQDGTDYLNYGYSKNIIDNLIDARMIEPLIAVFVKPNDRNTEYAFEERYNYANFFVTELLPFIEAEYRCDENGNRRLLIGDSFGGNISALISYLNPELFANIGLHSPAFWPNNYEVYDMIINGETKALSYYLVWGTYESLLTNVRNFRDSLVAKGYELEWGEYPEGHSWGLWRANTDAILTHFFPFNLTQNIIQYSPPHQFKLLQNYPNPFNPETIISFELPASGHVELKIYDVLGNVVETLIKDFSQAGNYSIIFRPSDLASGVYLYRLSVNNYSETKKLTYIK